jgi:hypothetical protein
MATHWRAPDILILKASQSVAIESDRTLLALSQNPGPSADRVQRRANTNQPLVNIGMAFRTRARLSVLPTTMTGVRMRTRSKNWAARSLGIRTLRLMNNLQITSFLLIHCYFEPQKLKQSSFPHHLIHPRQVQRDGADCLRGSRFPFRTCPAKWLT